jgi:GAF domain-containing protein
VREAVTDGVDEALREEVLDVVLPVGDITRRAMGEGRVGITDIKDPSPYTLPEVSLRLLRRLGAASFEGLGLNASGENMGVLYLVYKERREFRQEETHIARTFATHAAVALQKDKLVRQIAKDQRAAWEFTELVTLSDLKETLRSFVERTKKEIHCHAVTLFIYNDATDRILPLTTMTGVRDEKQANHCENAPRDSIVYKMLDIDQPHICISRVAEHNLFRNQPFVKREGIESVCAVPLKVKGHRVGVMFLNYRTPHSFTEAELDNILLLANQAAVAIHNGLLYGEQLRFVELSKQLLGARDREEALGQAVKNAAEALGAEFVAIVLPDENGRPEFKAWKGWTAEDVQSYSRGEAEDYQTGFTIRHGEPIFVTDYAHEDRFTVPNIVMSKGIKSGLSVPMFSGDEPVGAMLVHFQTPRDLTKMKEWTGTLSLIANLTAIYIKTIASKIASLEAVQRASDEISRISIDTDQSEVLDRIVEQAVACLPQAFMGTIQLYDEKRNELRFESVYSREGYEHILKLVDERRPLVRRAEGGSYQGKIGIAGRAVLEKAPQLIDDVELDSDYFRFSPETKSELAVPLLTDDNRVLGVLNIESKKPAAFSKDDEQAIMALAKLVVATIQKADQYRLLEGAEPYRRLEETQRLVNSSATLAWLGMASSIWGHSVAGHALDIRDNLELLRSKLSKYDLQPELKKLLDDKLRFIDEIARQIRQKPITALLSYDDATEDVSINWLIAERVRELQGDSRYSPVNFELHLTGEAPRVRCSPDWIRKMLDILIDNAVDAMASRPSPCLTIITRVVSNKVEIVFRDTGPGIPPDIKHKLFRQRIEKSPGSKGLGIGLLMVQAIAQTYRGEARVGTSPTGATIYVRLPVVELPGVKCA